MGKPMRSRYENGMGRIRLWVASAGVAIGLAIAALSLFGCRDARGAPVVHRPNLRVADWPAGARSARLLAGALAPLHPRLGTFAVLGNHDHWTAPAEITAALKAAGVRVLANQAVARGPVSILGVDDAFSGHADPSRVLDAKRQGFPILLSHSPDLLATLPPGRAPLVLLGHTHCGQVVLPWLGSPVRLSPFTGQRLYDPRYRCGVVRDAGRVVVVTAGLGTSGVPLRIGAPPDWWLITLSPGVQRTRR